MPRALARCTLATLLAALVIRCGGDTQGSGPAPLNHATCSESPQCIVRPASCCGQCGAATRDDLVAVRADASSAYQAQACGGATSCPTCDQEQDPRLIATCAAGRCQVVDLALHDATACTSDAGCRIRSRDCCECGGSTARADLVAVASSIEADDALMALVCGPRQPCNDCAPGYPDAAVPRCQAGHCVVEWVEAP